MENTLRISSFNCRSIKSSIESVRNLCLSHDVVLLQEHWLTTDELHILSNIHNDFYAFGVSAIDTENVITAGRPYGGVAILWRKSLGNSIKAPSKRQS